MRPSSPSLVKTSRGNVLLLVPLAGVGAELGLREVADRLLEELLLLGKAEVQRASSRETSMVAEGSPGRQGRGSRPTRLGQTKRWKLPRRRELRRRAEDEPLYRFVETAAASAASPPAARRRSYCPSDDDARADGGVRARGQGRAPSYSTPACGTPAFTDVPASSPFCRWIEDCLRRGAVRVRRGQLLKGRNRDPRTDGRRTLLCTLDPALAPTAGGTQTVRRSYGVEPLRPLGRGRAGRGVMPGPAL